MWASQKNRATFSRWSFLSWNPREETAIRHHVEIFIRERRMVLKKEKKKKKFSSIYCTRVSVKICIWCASNVMVLDGVAWPGWECFKLSFLTLFMTSSISVIFLVFIASRIEDTRSFMQFLSQLPSVARDITSFFCRSLQYFPPMEQTQSTDSSTALTALLG